MGKFLVDPHDAGGLSHAWQELINQLHSSDARIIELACRR
jgi:hypothetical protein